MAFDEYPSVYACIQECWGNLSWIISCVTELCRDRDCSPFFLDMALSVLWSVFDIFVTRSPVEASPHLVPGRLLFLAILNVVKTLTYQSVLGQTIQFFCAECVMEVYWLFLPVPEFCILAFPLVTQGKQVYLIWEIDFLVDEYVSFWLNKWQFFKIKRDHYFPKTVGAQIWVKYFGCGPKRTILGADIRELFLERTWKKYVVLARTGKKC